MVANFYCPSEFFFSVRMITHEPLHVAGWNFTWTCILTTARTLLIFKVVGEGHWTGFSDCLPLRDRAKKFVDLITYEPLNLS